MAKREAEARLFQFYLGALHELGSALADTKTRIEQSRPLRESLYRVLGTFAIGRGALLLWDAEQRRLTPAVTKGYRTTRRLTIDLTPAQARSLSSTTEPFHPHAPPGGLAPVAEQLRRALERIQVELFVPLSTGSTLIGLLMLGRRVHGDPLSGLELKVLEEMASVLALRIEEVRARRELAGTVRQLQRANRQLRQIYFESVRALATAMDGPSDGEEATHSARVAALAAGMARQLGLAAARRESLYLAGLLHDIGKQLINRDLLSKPGPLGADERRMLEAAPEAAWSLISHLAFPWGDVARIIRHQYERLDGQGYPDRLNADEIALEAKILMMAEAFDSMTSDRPWRPRLPPAKIAEQIGRNLGVQFESRVAEALCAVVEAGLEGQAPEDDFVPHLESAFDPTLIRQMLTELRRHIRNPEMRPHARVIEIVPREEA